MTEPCVQESRVNALETSMESISICLVELRNTAKETYRVLADIAKQGAEIGAVVSRVDKCELQLSALDVRLRALDEILISHTEIMRQHEIRENERKAIRTPIIAGLVVASVVALMAFLIWLVDKNQYTQPQAPPAAVQAVNRRGK